MNGVPSTRHAPLPWSCGAAVAGVRGMRTVRAHLGRAKAVLSPREQSSCHHLNAAPPPHSALLLPACPLPALPFPAGPLLFSLHAAGPALSPLPPPPLLPLLYGSAVLLICCIAHAPLPHGTCGVTPASLAGAESHVLTVLRKGKGEREEAHCVHACPCVCQQCTGRGAPPGETKGAGGGRALRCAAAALPARLRLASAASRAGQCRPISCRL